MKKVSLVDWKRVAQLSAALAQSQVWVHGGSVWSHWMVVPQSASAKAAAEQADSEPLFNVLTLAHSEPVRMQVVVAANP